MDYRRKLPIFMLLAVIVGAMALLFAACGDDDDETTTPAATPTNTSAPTKPAEQSPTTPPATPTTANPGQADLAKVQPVLDALRTGDTAKLQSLVKYTPVACADNVQGFPQPPKCEGKPAGTKVDVFPHASCEGGYATPANIGPVLQGMTGKVFKVYKQATDKGTPEFPQGIYGVIVYTGTDSTAANTGRLIGLDADGKIVTFWTGCGASARNIDETRGAGATPVFIPQ